MGHETLGCDDLHIILLTLCTPYSWRLIDHISTGGGEPCRGLRDSLYVIGWICGYYGWKRNGRSCEHSAELINSSRTICGAPELPQDGDSKEVGHPELQQDGVSKEVGHRAPPHTSSPSPLQHSHRPSRGSFPRYRHRFIKDRRAKLRHDPLFIIYSMQQKIIAHSV